MQVRIGATDILASSLDHPGRRGLEID